MVSNILKINILQLFFLVSFLHGSAAVAQAQTVNPFFARVDVADRSGASRAEGQQQALAAVLVKLTGHAEEVARVATPAVLERAASMLEQFRFIPGLPQLQLEAHFNPRLVQQLAAELGLPVWPLERGQTLVWVVYDLGDGNGRQLVDDNTPAHDALRQALVDGAANSAVPIILPQWSQESEAPVPLRAVWGGFVGELEAASEDYATPNVMAGRVYPTQNGWRSEWTLDTGDGQQPRWSAAGDDIGAAIDRGLAGMAERLADRYVTDLSAGYGGEGRTIRLMVRGVDSAERYGALLSYLNGLSVIQAADPVAAQGDQVELELDSRTSLEGLRQVFRLANVLAPWGSTTDDGFRSQRSAMGDAGAEFELVR